MSSTCKDGEGGPIRLSCLTAPKFKNGTALKVVYTLPDVDHPIYGKATGLTGELQLLVPHGSYPISNYLEMTKGEQDEILTGAINRLRHLQEDMDDEEVEKKFQGLIISAAFSCPRFDARGPHFQLVVDDVITSFAFDDIFDEDQTYPEGIGVGYVYKNYHLVQNAISGNREKLLQLAKTAPPGYESLVEQYLETIRKAEQLIPSLNMEHVFREDLKVTESSVLLLPIAGADFSQESRRALRGNDSGMGHFHEFGAALSGIHLQDFVRQSLLFQMFFEGVKYFGGLMNDIIGLTKDVKNSATNATVVLRRVVNEQISLQQSFEEESKRLQHVAKDIEIAGKKLVEAFPEEKSVAAFVQFCYEAIDGQVYDYILLSQLNNRYGSLQMELCTVV